jgi:hypothetical protein
MSLRARIDRLEKRFQPDGFCCRCMRVAFRFAGEPDPRPPICPICGRGPGDYPEDLVRAFVIHRPLVCGLKELPVQPEPNETVIGSAPV